MNIFKRILQAGKNIFRSSNQTATSGSVSAGFVGGRLNRLTADWVTSPVTMDAKIWKDLTTLQARSRDLVDNNSTGKRWVQLSKTNIVGAGMRLQMKVKKANGDLDKTANDKIEKAWKEWSKAANCTVDRRTTLRQFQRKCVASYKIDGECIIQIKRNFRNKFNFALMFVDPERLDVNFNRGRTKTQNEIRLGVELNKFKEPVAYYFKKQNDNVSSVLTGGSVATLQRQRVPASEIIHFYVNDRVDQTRGYPQMASVMTNL